MPEEGLVLKGYGDLSEWSAGSFRPALPHFCPPPPPIPEYSLPYLSEALTRHIKKSVPHRIIQTSGLEKESLGNVRQGDQIRGPDLDGVVKESLRVVLAQPRPK